jgi:hypothetical protein
LYTTSHKNQPWLSAHRFTAGAVLNFVSLCLLNLFAWLREEPLFWTNAGGWPIWLRDLVGISFYPLLLIQLLVLTAFTGGCLFHPSPRRRRARPEAATLPILWSLFLLVVVIFAANNLGNLVTARPLHWHAQ